MTKYQRALALSCMLAALPIASTAVALNANQSVLSNGKSVAAVESSSNVSMNYSGSPLVKGSPDRAATESSSAEFARMLALKPAVAPRGSAESIIGADNRVLVNPTTSYPYRAIVLITFNTPQGGSRCSGWFINANTIATAGHCVHPGGGGSFYATSSYRIYPGKNGAASPYGVCSAKWLASVGGWTSSGSDAYDYGAIKLNCTKGNTVGWFGYFWTTNSLLDFTTNISGYPGDKPLTQWRHVDWVRATDSYRVFYQNDTFGGQSGSPVWTSWRACEPCSGAIHAYGLYGSGLTASNNHGTRIRQPVFANYQSWAAAP